MAIKNKKTSSKESSVENRLRAKLKESYNDEFLNEDDEDNDLDLSLDLDDDDSEEDMDASGDEFGGDDFDDEGDAEDFSDDDFGGEDEELTPDQDEYFDDQIDSLLEPEVEDAELSEDVLMSEADEEDEFSDEDFSDDDFGDDDNIDIESEPDELESFEDDLEDEFAEDGAIDDEELGEIIDAPNTYDLLGDTLKQAAIEEIPSEDEEDEFSDEDFSDDDDLEEGFDLYDQTGNHDQVGSKRPVVNEAKKQTKKSQMKKQQSAKKPVPKNSSLKEDVKLPSELTALNFDEEDSDLEGTYAKVTKPEGKEGKVEHGKGLTQTMKQELKKESVEKSKMLVKAAKHIDKLSKKIKQLQLENYRLVKSNGILSAAADRLDKASRSKISESFGKCKSTSQVDQLYSKIVNTIKQKARPSLNEAVSKVKTGVKHTNILHESDERETLSLDQQRINMLMGINTNDDVYMKF